MKQYLILLAADVPAQIAELSTLSDSKSVESGQLVVSDCQKNGFQNLKMLVLVRQLSSVAH
jgi:hypothetical protein